MKDYEGLIIKKGGKLIDQEWDGDIGEYIQTDVTKKAGFHLFRNCKLDQDITLKDILLLIKANIDVMKVVLNNWVEEIVDEGLNGIPNLSEHVRDFDYLEIYWILTKVREYEEFEKPIPAPEGSIHHKLGNGFIYGTFSGPKRIEGGLHPDFHGVSKPVLEGSEFAEQGWKVGSRVNLGVSMTPACDIAHIPLKLNEQWCICDDAVNDDFSTDNTEVYEGCQYSLGHILYTIIWELTWFGSPKSRNEKSKELKEAVKELENKDNE